MTESYVSEIFEQPRDPLGGASGEKRHFHVTCLGKSNNKDFPFTVANEVVASQIGMALGLNLPTVMPAVIDGEDVVLVQMAHRDPRMQLPPPATAGVLRDYVAGHQDEVHGAIVFDLFVANNDRAFGPERRNLFLDQAGELLLYDNGNACFYRNRPSAGIVAGIPRLDAVERDLTALFDMEHKENHYRELLTDWGLVEKWCGRIAELPEYFIESAVHRIPAGTAQEVERRRLCEFLVVRRLSLLEQIKRHPALFPALSS